MITDMLNNSGWHVNHKRVERIWQREGLKIPLPALSADCSAIACRVIDELLNGEVFYTLREAQILIERWRHHYNTVRPHSALRYRPPAPESMMLIDQRPTMH
jgi:hypothetical protein